MMDYGYAKQLIVRALPWAKGRPAEQEAERAFRSRQLQAARANPKGWPWQRRSVWRRNRGGYDTGTATVTKDSRDVTFSGATLPTDVTDWLVGFPESETEVYKVESRYSTSAVKLNRPYEQDSGSGKEYRMCDPYIRAPADLYAWEAITIEADGRRLKEVSIGFNRAVAPGRIELDEGYVIAIGPAAQKAAHDDGTVNVVAGSSAVSGTSSDFPEWVADHHIRLEGESRLYRIYQWSSTTLLILDRAYGNPARTAVNYGIDPKGCMQLEFQYPREDQFAARIDYWAEPEEHVNNTDVIEGSEAYAQAIVDLATADVLLSTADPGYLDDRTLQGAQQRAAIFRDRGLAALQQLIGSNAPEPETEAVLRDIRFASGGGGFSPLRKD